ncbi:hypothetical protein [Streptomyces sp. NPDC059271]
MRPHERGESGGGPGREAETARGLPEMDLRAVAEGLTGRLTD